MSMKGMVESSAGIMSEQLAAGISGLLHATRIMHKSRAKERIDRFIYCLLFSDQGVATKFV
jgi:hypothetical protein